MLYLKKKIAKGRWMTKGKSWASFNETERKCSTSQKK